MYLTTSHYVALLPAILTGLVAAGLMVIGLRSRTRRIGFLLAAFCAAMLAEAGRNILGRLIGDPAVFSRWDRIFLAAFHFVLPVAVHLIHVLLRIEKWRWFVRALYLLTLAAAPAAILSDWFVSGYLHRTTGLIAQPGPGMYAYTAVSLVAATVYLPLLVRALGQREKKVVGLRAFVYGLLGCLLLCFGDILAGVGQVDMPPSVFCFIPLAVMGFSLLHFDVSATGRQVVDRGIANDLAFGLLLILAALLATLLPELYAGQTPDDVLNRFFPSALPATLSAVVCLVIALAAFAKGESSMSTLLFGICCALWGFYSADLALVATVADKGIAEWISRVDHLGMVLNVPVSFHLGVTVSKRRIPRWMVPFTYGLAVFTAPFVFTDWYISGMHEYWFGYFAQAGPLMNLYLAIEIPFLLYGFWLLWRASRTDAEAKVRNLARYMLTGMVGAFLLLVGAIPGISGIPLYPASQFLFAPFIVMAYGILVTRSMAFRTFLRLGVARIVITFALSLLLAVGIVLLVRAISGYRLWLSVLILALVSAIAFEPLTRTIYGWLERVLTTSLDESAYRFRPLLRKLTASGSPTDTARILARETVRILDAESTLVLLGEKEEARLSGVRVEGRTILPVQVWSDDPVIKSLHESEVRKSRPDVPIVTKGVLYDLIPELKLIAPVSYKGTIVALIALGPRLYGKAYDPAVYDWLQELAAQVAPVLQLAAYEKREAQQDEDD